MADTKLPCKGLILKFKNLLKDALEANDLFGICFGGGEKDSFTKSERFVSLCCFVAMQVLVTSLLSDFVINDAAACACIQGKPVGRSPHNNCTSVGDTLFSLPGNGAWRKEWYNYTKADLPLECMFSPNVPQGNKTYFCDPVYACCYAYLDDIVEKSELASYPSTHVDPCPSDPTTQTIVGSLLSTILSLLCFKPLVKTILMLETQLFNCFAYVLVVLQIFLAVVFYSDYMSHSEDLFVPKDETKTLDVIGASALMGLCVWSPIYFIGMKLGCECCTWCCCCGGGCCHLANEPEDNDQKLEQVNLADSEAGTDYGTLA